MPTGKGPLRIAIEDFIEGFDIGSKIRGWFTRQLENYEEEAIDNYGKLLAHFGIQDEIPDIAKPASIRALVTHQIELLVTLLPMLWEIATQFVQMFIIPFMRPLSYFAESLAHSRHASMQELVQMIQRRPDLEAKLKSMLPGTGYDDVSYQGYVSLLRQYLTPIDYQRLLLRGAIDQGSFSEIMKQLGIADSDVKNIGELANIIPSVNDLITLQVKEAFNDEASSRFHHDEGDVSQVITWAKKQGLNEEWVKRYWRAHWQLPSPSQVFEMLQRLRPGTTDTPVTKDDVNEYLQIADFSPFWRERLTQISYNPVTRVDIRRMYKMHVYDEAQVKEAYLNIGYSEKDAQALTAFTIAYEAEEETGIVRSAVTSAYSIGNIDRGTAEQMLRDGGYDDTSIAFYLNNEDFKNNQQVLSIKLANIKQKYINGLIDETNVNNEINQLNLPAERVTALLELWGTERENQTTLLTVSQMEILLEDKIVTEDDFKRIAKQRGYTEESIKWTLDRIALEAANKAKNEAEKAQADAERLAKSKTASQYQKDKSSIDLDIAQAKAENTDIDVALHGDISDEDAITLNARKDELKKYIASKNVEKAQLRFDTEKKLNPPEA